MPLSSQPRLPLNELILATRNPKKLREYNCLLGNLSCRVVTIEEVVPEFRVDEDGDSFEANALKKAFSAFEVVGRPVLAEDSGLEVDSLNRAPGVRSARFAPDDEARCRKVLKLLSEIEPSRRAARFRCVVVLAWARDGYRIFEGVCEGMIADKMAGQAGFGYDPIFIPAGYSRTFAQLGLEVKNRLSHRARAVEKLKLFLASGHGAVA